MDKIGDMERAMNAASIPEVKLQRQEEMVEIILAASIAVIFRVELPGNSIALRPWFERTLKKVCDATKPQVPFKDKESYLRVICVSVLALRSLPGKIKNAHLQDLEKLLSPLTTWDNDTIGLSDEAVTKFKYLEVARKNVTPSFSEAGMLGKDQFSALLEKSRIRYIIYKCSSSLCTTTHCATCKLDGLTLDKELENGPEPLAFKTTPAPETALDPETTLSSKTAAATPIGSEASSDFSSSPGDVFDC